MFAESARMAGGTGTTVHVSDVRESLRWVERLLEPGISDTLLLEAAQHLTHCQYCDVVEERTILGLCGWPACERQLGHVPRQKYHISLEHQRVVDLTERKKFCSSECYRASKVYSLQVSSATGWPRKEVQAQPQSQRNDMAPSRSPALPRPTNPHPVPITEQHTLPHPFPSHDDEPLQRVEPEEDSDQSEQASVQRPKLSSVGRLLQAFSSWQTPQTLELLHSTGPGGSEGGGKGGGEVRESRESFLPPVHNVTQAQLQRNIFLQQLKRNLPCVVGPLGLTVQQTLPSLTALTNTFSLDRHTIMFRPPQWRVLILVLLLSSKTAGQDFTSPQRSTIEQWLVAVGASHTDLQLMVDTFTGS